MKTTLCLVTLFLASLCLAGPIRAEKTPLKVGQTFTMEVPDQGGSTGYSLVLKSLPSCVGLVSVETRSSAAGKPMGGSPAVGAPETKVFTFVALAPGRGLIEINSARLWEKPHTWTHKATDKKATPFFRQVLVEE